MSESLADPSAQIEALENEVANLRQQLNREVAQTAEAIGKIRQELKSDRKGILERLTRLEAKLKKKKKKKPDAT